MTDPMRRKSTVREALNEANLFLKQRVIVGKLRGRYLFRAAVRLVIEYKDWIGNGDSENIGDDVTVNVKLAQRKKSSEQEDLTVKDRSILLISPHKRSKDDVAYIEYLLKEIKAFKRYPEDVRESLASDCGYQFVPAGRTIIRQNHKARLLYYVVSGQLQISRDLEDPVTEEAKQIDAGMLKPGDMFGEIALLHQVPRTATVVSKTPVDLLLITRKMFNIYLRHFLLEEWDILRDALVNFNYFKGWTEETMRECCILSKIVNYKPNEVLLGDGKGMIHYVYFLLNGECRLVEHMLVEKKRVGKHVKYKLYDSQQKDRNPRQRIGRSKKLELPDDELSAIIMESASQDGSMSNITAKEQPSSPADYIKLISSKKPNTNIAIERVSVITVTLQDVINQWHEITDVVEMLMRQPSTTNLKNYPKNVKTVFMQICTFYRGACFGLGEQMKNRRVVSITPSRCLLIPRYWLTQHNRANIWERVKQFMNSVFPDNKQLLDKYVENKMWAKHKKEYAKNIVKCGRDIPNDTKLCDVPYSIRINENIIDE
ncbi:cyclic nucleotide-binding domain-containing protein 2 [Nasonia vitripennis]|uniref:Cyclic nucleotide-binding domain-containing protein n=1 Tax=Nasonia vitripennis TaxID=7425 RepID=A0A7M7QAF2_NASVI|nr:cyclic nucleotide-binding domain-containing protein 2 [Nasonia vitripennis]